MGIVTDWSLLISAQPSSHPQLIVDVLASSYRKIRWNQLQQITGPYYEGSLLVGLNYTSQSYFHTLSERPASAKWTTHSLKIDNCCLESSRSKKNCGFDLKIAKVHVIASNMKAQLNVAILIFLLMCHHAMCITHKCNKNPASSKQIKVYIGFKLGANITLL